MTSKNTPSSVEPTIVLIHGLWGDGAHWADVITELKKKGHTKIRAVENPLTSLPDDAARTRKLVETLEGPVVLVGHSYGGEVITEMGDMPNVKALVYISAWAPEKGQCADDLCKEAPAPGLQAVKEDKFGYLWIAPDKFHEFFCQDVPEDKAFVMAVTQKAPLAGLLKNRTTAAAWENKPSWYQLSTQDRMILPEQQREFAKRVKARRVLELPTSHAPMATHPEAIAGLIDEAARS
ncbi:alpha/beta fold hydrolase [Oecophyllibacter saccharovorans]|uniref:Alpha/beta hydrolase n=1 Tax=Oecophyllibacter saccharovorans TaxID=2558360 RepID=A0A506UKV3_9PROT|nr:alpha/beta hydrolase [Oecophyllibacter saccharovorans]QDH15143.1 alpha/beta hydrolase [Oecophyllibacter saccharovorans]TPW33704.1 alpha/beta hydrolase [Oecophyllibacter saccharovorans]TPW33981.1 alpha/beta hydrolase [Oecophyllibacter saccharovorans]